MDKKQQQAYIMKKIIIDIDIANQNCADCQKKNVAYASINNGTIICTECAKEHQKLGTSLSYLRGFCDKWDDYLLTFIRIGGNSRFLVFATCFKIFEMKISDKYKTKASEYYRELLRSEVMGYDPPDSIDIDTSNEILSEIPDNYPEFQNYSFVKHVDLDKLEKNYKKSEEGGLFTSFKGFFSNFGNKLNNAADVIANKVADLTISEKIFEKGSQAIDKVKNLTESAKGKIQDIFKEDEDKNGEGNEEGDGQQQRKIEVPLSLNDNDNGNNIIGIKDSNNNVKEDKINDDKINQIISEDKKKEDLKEVEEEKKEEGSEHVKIDDEDKKIEIQKEEENIKVETQKEEVVSEEKDEKEIKTETPIQTQTEVKNEIKVEEETKSPEREENK